MHGRELAPRDRDHLRRRVELHRARAERDHRRGRAPGPCRRAGAGSAASRFRAMRWNTGCVRNGVRAHQRRGQAVCHDRRSTSSATSAASPPNARQDPRDVRRAASSRRARCRASPHRRAGSSCRARPRARECACVRSPVATTSVSKYARVGTSKPEPSRPRFSERGQPVHAPRDRTSGLRRRGRRRTCRDHREQHLRGADVRRRLLAADVLLARLQREPVRRIAVRVDGHADEAARHRALECVARREKPACGPP